MKKPLRTSFIRVNSDTIKKITNAMSLSKKNKRGNTALHNAVLSNDTEVLKHLLTIKIIDINAINNKGMTALHLATQAGHTESVELLLKMGADIEVQNNQGLTSLDLANNKNNMRAKQLISEYNAVKALVLLTDASNRKNPLEIILENNNTKQSHVR